MKAPARRNKHGAPFQLPTGIGPAQATMEPSPHQIGAASRAEDKQAMGMGDQASTMESLAQIAPISNQTRLRGPALKGLQRAAGI